MKDLAKIVKLIVCENIMVLKIQNNFKNNANSVIKINISFPTLILVIPHSVSFSRIQHYVL